MRAAVIFGLGSDERDLRPFQKNSRAEWVIGLPGSASEADALLIFGGDGTVHRHLRRLVELGLPVLVVPRGSGNDFARALGLRSVRDSVKAWEKFLSGGEAKRIDLGVIRELSRQGLKPLSNEQGDRSADALRHPKPDDEHYFCCVGGVGLDSEVARRANGLPRWLRGHGGYVVSLPPTLFRFAALPMRISVASGANMFAPHSEKPTVLAAFANTPTYGGGMKIAPRAQMDDGKLDVCIITDIDKLKLFCLFPSVYFGKHVSMEEVEYLQTERLRIETEKPLAVYADGEYVCETPIEVGVLPRGLGVIV